MASAQVGKTEAELNLVGYLIHLDPCPILCVLPTVDLAQSWSRERLTGMIRETEPLRGLVAEAKEKSGENTLLSKTFPGGSIALVGSNSPAGLASRPIRVVIFDEVDRFETNPGNEGDVIELATKRTQTFWNSKIIMVSTPTITGASIIEDRFLQSDQRYYQVPCLECGAFSKLTFGGLKFERDENKNLIPSSVGWFCPHCNHKHTEKDKTALISAGQWVAEKPFNGTAGFFINELYSPFSTWEKVIKAFLAAKHSRSKERMQAFTNLVLGETFAERGEGVDHTGLINRIEKYPAEVPAGALYLTASVDVQHDRLEYFVLGHGKNSEQWAIAYDFILGDPASLDTWTALDKKLQQPYKHESGLRLYIRRVFVDSGYLAETVYRFVKPRQARGIFASKGQPGNKPFVSRPSLSNSAYVNLFHLGVDDAKSDLYSRLTLTEPGPRYIHYPNNPPHGLFFDDRYFRGLTAEERIQRKSKGIASYYWKKKYERNEPLDLYVYARAAFETVQVDLIRLEADLKREAEALKPQPVTPTATQPQNIRPSHAARPSSNWVMGNDAGKPWI
jgi:phage terminase large subunit GpA-like protein